MRDTGWFKSTRSGGATDNCVEVRITAAATRLRDSKNPGVVIVGDLGGLVAAIRADRLGR